MKKLTLFLSAMLLACATNLWAADTYEQLTSIASIDETAQYVLGIEGTGFHYSGTSSWGLTALPTTKTPIYYTLKKAADGKSFTATATISEKEYYLSVPTSNDFSMVETSTTNPTNINLIIGTTQITGTNYAVANATTKTRHLRINGTNGLRSYAGTTGKMAYFYKVTFSSATLSSLTISGTPTQLNYTKGETFNPAGLTVTAKYSDDSSEDVTDNANLTWTITPKVLTEETTSVTVKATLGDVTSEGYVVDNVVVIGAPQPGDAVTVTFEAGVDNASSENKTTITKKGITLTATTFDNTSYYQTYANGTFKASSTQGKITSIVFTCKGNGTNEYGPGHYSVPKNGVGTYGTNGNTGTWSGSAAEVVLSASKQVRMTKVVVTYEQADPDAPDAPTISGESTFHGSTKVTITAGENLKIYYTTNGDDPTTASTLYTAPFSITATTTVKAIAVNETTSSVSDVAEKTFTHQDAITLSAIDYTTDGTKVFLQPVTVVYAKDAYTYLKDETGVGLLYGGNFNLTAGDIVAGIAATTKVYSKLPELLPAVTLEDLTVTSGAAPSPAEAKAVPTAEEVNTYLLLKGVTLAADAATTKDTKLQNVTVPFKDGTIDLRDQFGVVTDGTIKAGSYDIEGFVSVYNTTVQFYITKITSTATAIDNAAIETPVIKTIENGQLVILRDGVKYNAMGVRLQ